MSDKPEWKKVHDSHEQDGWLTVSRAKGRRAQPVPVLRVLAETASDRNSDKCTEGHAECLQSPEKLCVYKLRKKIKCSAQTRSPFQFPYGKQCYFGHEHHQQSPG